MAIGAPSLRSATAINTTRIDLAWINGDEYDFVHIERKLASNGGWVQIDMVEGSAEYYADEYPPLTPGETYDYQIRGRKLYPVEEYSGYSGTKTATTFAVLAAPSDLVVTAFADFVELTFKDNSLEEVKFEIAREKDSEGEAEEFAWLAANMDYYRDEAGIVAGSVYKYRVRAWRSEGDESAWTGIVSATALSVPGNPAGLGISEIQDTSMRLTWTGVANETGYKIEISDTGDFTGEEVTKVIGADIVTFLATGLDSSQQYWFRIYAYNGVGNSAGFTANDDTTLASGVYTPTEFEKWIRDPNIEPVYLAEIYVKMDLTGFTLESGVTWKKTIPASDRGIDILEVFEDGDAYSSTPTQISEVEALASSFWFNYDARILYVHTSDDSDPSNFLIEGAFWLYFSTHKDVEFTANGRLQHFLPLLARGDIPDITQEIKPYFEGSFAISSGSIAFKNATGFFDKIFSTYTWINAKTIVKAGKDTFAYGDFKEIFTLYIDSKSCSDAKITFQLRDLLKVMSHPIVLDKYWKTDQGDGKPFYPDMDESHEGRPIPTVFGGRGVGVSIAVDMENQKFNYHNGRSKSVELVTRNSVELVKDTHYYVDLQRSILTFDRDGKFIIEAGVNDEIDFKEDAVVKNATIDPGTYTTLALAAEMKRVMELAGGFTYTITCSGAPERLFSINGVGGALQLLWKTGANGSDGTDTHIGTTIGYNDDEDDTGANTYIADEDVITIVERDTILVAFTGLVNSADEVINNGAEVFKYLMNTYKSLADSELDLDSIYQSKYANENVLVISLESEPSFDEIVRTIEHSIEAYTFQDVFGRLGIKPQQTVVASNAKYIISKHIFGHSQKKNRSTLFWKVNVYYNKDYNEVWDVKTAISNTINWKYKVTEELPINTYFRHPPHAQSLATSILSLLNKEQIEVEAEKMLLFDVMPGDLIKFSRIRFYDLDGTASEITLRVLRISKSPAIGGTSIIAEVVS